MTDLPWRNPAVPLPATLDYLRLHALKSPARPMLRYASGGTVTCSGLYRGVLQVSAALRCLGVRQGELVAVGHLDPCMHLLLLLGCESLGATTVSYLQSEWLGLESLFAQVDRVLSEEPGEGQARLSHCLDMAWFKDALAAPPADREDRPDLPRSPDDPMRLLRSSGTTGEPKLIMMTRARMEHLLHRLMERHGFTSRSVELLTMRFAVNRTYLRACLCMRLGATVVVGEATHALREFGVTHMVMLPLDLRRLLGRLPPDWRKPERPVALSVIGGPAAETLRAGALEKLCTEFSSDYATNEAGGIAEMDSHDRGILQPGVEVRIVDDDGAELALGSEGHVAVRAPCMSTGYWRQPEATARFFRDGWFHPGDRARLLGPRQIELLGRGDDVLNLDGIKRAPEAIEQVFLSHPLVRDVAATTVPRSDGMQQLHVAVVLAEPGSGMQEVVRGARARLPSWAAGMRVLECSSIPRTPNGKIRRAELRKWLSSLFHDGT